MEEKEDSLPALTVSCYLALWSPCPQRYPRETQSSLQARKQQALKLFFFSSKTSSKQWTSPRSQREIKHDRRGHFVLTWRDGSARLCSDRAGRHRGVGIRRQTLGQLLQLHADGNQIRRTQLSIYMLKLLHLQKRDSFDCNKMQILLFHGMAYFPQIGD